MAHAFSKVLAASVLVCATAGAWAGGGPLGIDSEVSGNATGIWKRGNQRVLEDAAVLGVLAGALWEGNDTRFGHTLWQSVDAIAIGQVGYAIVNRAAGRLRPSQTTDPNEWGHSGGHSFPSGDVTIVASAITPMVLEYGGEHPGMYALELLPAYDAAARVKSHAHWQSDVLAGWALGTAAGWYAHKRDVPLTVMVLPHQVTVGLHTRF
jgi:membrane-associated phospholipid phosphatase